MSCNPRHRACVLLFWARMLCHRAAELKPSSNEGEDMSRYDGYHEGIFRIDLKCFPPHVDKTNACLLSLYIYIYIYLFLRLTNWLLEYFQGTPSKIFAKGKHSYSTTRQKIIRKEYTGPGKDFTTINTLYFQLSITCCYFNKGHISTSHAFWRLGFHFKSIFCFWILGNFQMKPY